MMSGRGVGSCRMLLFFYCGVFGRDLPNRDKRQTAHQKKEAGGERLGSVIRNEV